MYKLFQVTTSSPCYISSKKTQALSTAVLRVRRPPFMSITAAGIMILVYSRIVAVYP